MALVPVAFDTVAVSGVYWNGTIWVAYGSGLVLPVDLGLITTPDALADFMIGATAATQKALVLQGSPAQSANIFEVQKSDGTVGVYITGNAQSLVVPGAVQAQTGIFSGCYLYLANYFYPGNNASAFIVQNDSYLNSIIGRVESDGSGTLKVYDGVNSPVIQLLGGSGECVFPFLVVGLAGSRFGPETTDDVVADTMMASTAVTQKPLVIQLLPGQTADAFEVQDSTGAVLFSIDASGVSSDAVQSIMGTLDGSGQYDTLIPNASPAPIACWRQTAGAGMLQVFQGGSTWQISSTLSGVDAGFNFQYLKI